MNQKKDNRLFIFLICVVIATTLWFANALGKDYTSTVSIPIKYTNLPKNKVLVKSPSTKLRVRIKAPGTTLLGYKLLLAFDPVKFDVKKFTYNQMAVENINTYNLVSNKYIRQISNQLGNKIEIQSISPDTLTFVFDHIVSHKKPVVQNFTLSFTNQFFLFDSIQFSPDSVSVIGPKSIVDTIKAVYTSPQNFKNLDATLQRNISLENIDDLELSPRRVVLEIPVSQYTEYVNTVSIECIGKPDSVNVVTFPGVANISCLAAINEHKNISSSSFLIGVNYQEIIEGKDMLTVSAYSTPPHIKLLKFQPERVEYIIEKK